MPVHVTKASGVYFWDERNNRYLDFSSQVVCSNLGHGNETVVKAIIDQAARLPFIHSTFASEILAKLCELLNEVVPKHLVKYFLSTSGTEANEAAIKIARTYTGRRKIVTRYRSYHGSTLGSMSVSGDLRRIAIESHGKAPGTVFAPDAYCYRCPFGLSYPDCSIACVEYVDYILKHEGDVAAVLVEPIVGGNGVLVPPIEYLPRLREITRDNGVLLIVDEVMSGFCRTGEWFAIDHFNVEPDILTSAKGLTGGYAPLGLTATSSEIADYFEEHKFSHGHTYTAHPLSVATAVAAIQEYKRIQANTLARKMGAYIAKRLHSLKTDHPSIGDVRGMGLLWGIELVKQRGSKLPFNSIDDQIQGKTLMVNLVADEMWKLGVYVMVAGDVLVVAPPLTISEQEIDEGIKALERALRISDREAHA